VKALLLFFCCVVVLVQDFFWLRLAQAGGFKKKALYEEEQSNANKLMGNNKHKKDKKNNKQAKSKECKAIGAAPTYTKQANVEDFLDETEMSSHEKFGCIMFASPGESMIETFKEEIAQSCGLVLEVVSKVVDEYIKREHPKRAVKYVGGRATPEECAGRIKRIMEEESSFHIFTMENGKWCTFDPSPELIENENYREEQLNEIIKGKKIIEARTKDFFRAEMRKKVEKARLEGTKEGQQILLEAEEPYQAVQHRAESADKSIEELRERIAELERTRALAAEKLEQYRAAGKDKVDPRLETDKKLESLRDRGEEDDGVCDTTRAKLSAMQAIQKEAVIPDNVSHAMVQMFQDRPIIPHDEKGKEEL
jgi:hypothetical protein